MNHLRIESYFFSVKNETIVSAVYLNRAGVHVAAVAAVAVIAVVPASHLVATGPVVLAVSVLRFVVVVDLLVVTTVTVEDVVAVAAVVNGVAEEAGLAAVFALAAAAVAVISWLMHVSFELQWMLSVVFFVVVSLQIKHNLFDLYLYHCFVWVPFCIWKANSVQ